jgi:hypothetical protein
VTVTELKRELEQAEELYHSEDSQAFQQLLEADLRSLARLRAAERRLPDLSAVAGQTENGVSREITRRLRSWIANAEVRLRQLQLQEEKGCPLAVADEFRRSIEEARTDLARRLSSEEADEEEAGETTYQSVPFIPAGTAAAQYGPIEDLAPLPYPIEEE